MENISLTDMATIPMTFENSEWEDWLRWDPATEPMSADVSSKSSEGSPFPSVGQSGESAVPWIGEDELPPAHPGIEQDSSVLIPVAKPEDALFDFSAAPMVGPFLFGQTLQPFPDQLLPLPGISDDTLQIPVDPMPFPLASAGPVSAVSEDSFQTSPTLADPVDSQQASPTSLTHGDLTATPNSPAATAPAVPARKKPGRKRKSDMAANPEDGSGPPQKKTSHNVIEKRYRNNLNDKITELRDCVPSLRAMSRPSGSEADEDLDGLTPAHKLNKSTVMAKATEYIKHLEKRNKVLSDEMADLRSRISSLEDSSASRSQSATSASRRRTLASIAESQTESSEASTSAEESMTESNKPQKANGRRANTLGKLMVGAMAGMMAVEGLHEQDTTSDSSSSRGLGAVPLNLLKRGASSEAVSDISSRQLIFAFVRLSLILSAFVYLVIPLFTSKPRRKTVRVVSKPCPIGKTSLTSPVEMRRSAWLTAIQKVWTPRPFLVEVVLVTVRMIELSLRRIIGFDRYAELLGMSKEDEAQRIKTWDIAIDAQLAGGDAQVNYYRLLLTIMASGTLPDSPIRLMQKAVHFDVFFWEMANAGYGNFFMFKNFTAYVAKIYWNSARAQHKAMLSGTASRHDELETSIDVLPDHLAALIELDCDDVLTDAIIQRSYNLAWNRPSAEDTQSSPTLDSVVEDHAVRSPLDAVAAWFTNEILDEALGIFIKDDGDVGEAEALIHLAVTTAPPASACLTRALVARAAMIDEGREENIRAAMAVLPSKSAMTRIGESSPTTMPLNVVDHIPLTPDIRTVLTFAKLLSIASVEHPANAHVHAATSLESVPVSLNNMTLLTAVAAVKIIDTFANNALLFSYGRAGLESLATNLRLWTRSSACRKLLLRGDQKDQIDDRCLMIIKRVGRKDSEELDSGYASCGRGRRLSEGILSE